MTRKKEKGPFVGGLQLQQKTLKLIQQAMSSDKILLSLAEIFTALADPTRLKIIQALSLKELRVCDLAYLIGLSISAISHQLRLLRHLRLVKFRKEGRMVFYSLADGHIETLLQQGLDHVAE
ncbi:MAG: helix-turn-helix transcriptional regulator [Candidatus Aminicenantes bacterium]|nr:helix-turn-helix transcriptional regulator [Candidatus Aminicenantes bacterium]